MVSLEWGTYVSTEVFYEIPWKIADLTFGVILLR